jgi:hypothetical protein
MRANRPVRRRIRELKLVQYPGNIGFFAGFGWNKLKSAQMGVGVSLVNPASFRCRYGLVSRPSLASF